MHRKIYEGAMVMNLITYTIMLRGENKLLQALFIFILLIAIISSPYIKFHIYDKEKINGSVLYVSEDIEIRKSITHDYNLHETHIFLRLRLVNRSTVHSRIWG